MENPRNRLIRHRNASVRDWKIGLLLAALLATVGCGESTASAGGRLPAASPQASAASASEDLSFSGALSGRMTSGTAGDTYICASAGGSFVAGPILGTVADKQVELNITKLSFTGAGSYAPGGVSFDVDASHYYPATGAPGTLVVAPDLKSGTVDINLAVNTDPDTVVAHVSGMWRCPSGGS
jgi:hypothetical protein